MKYHQTPHKKTKDKKSYITKLREEDQKKRDRLKIINDKKNEDDSKIVDDNSQWLKKISLSYIHTILKYYSTNLALVGFFVCERMGRYLDMISQTYI